MFLLIPLMTVLLSGVLLSLHSTMFLLIQYVFPWISTGFLFTFHYVSINTFCLSAFNFFISYFTFHYVSIKTGTHPAMAMFRQNFTFHYVSINTHLLLLLVQVLLSLHSTMFLLIHFFSRLNIFCDSNFTFHYVSINTHPVPTSPSGLHTLHSTMFLLIPIWNITNLFCKCLYIPLCFY